MKIRPMMFFEADPGGGGGTPAAPASPAPAPAAPAPAPGGAPSLLDPGNPGGNTPAADGRPDWMPEKFWSEGKPNVEGLAKSYAGLEQLLGQKANAVRIPTEQSTPEEVAAYRKALGVPEKVEDYQIKPEQLPEGVEWNDDLAKPFAEIAHKHNIPPKAMSELVAKQAEIEAQRTGALAGQIEAKRNEGIAELKQTFGDSFDRKLVLAQRAAQTAGVDPNAPGFSDPAVVKGFVRLAEMISEDQLTAPGTPTGPAGAQSRAKDIQTNPQNPLYAKYQDGDPDTVNLVRGLLQGKA